IPTTLTPPKNLFPVGGYGSDPIAASRTLVFDQGLDASGMFVFTVNGQQFPNPPLIQSRLNTVEEGTLINPTNDVHPFHSPQNAFQIMSVNGIPLNPDGTPVTIPNVAAGGQSETYVGGGLTDVVDIPAAVGITPGEVVIRMKFEDFLGSYVYHCHRV